MGSTCGCRNTNYMESGQCTIKSTHSSSGNAMCAFFLMLFILGIMVAGGILIKMMTHTSSSADLLLSTRLMANEIDARAEQTEDVLDGIQKRLDQLNSVDISEIDKSISSEGRRTRGALKTQYDATTSRINQIVVEQGKLRGLLQEILCEVKKLRD